MNKFFSLLSVLAILAISSISFAVEENCNEDVPPAEAPSTDNIQN